jgi:hypothetical protein
MVMKARDPLIILTAVVMFVVFMVKFGPPAQSDPSNGCISKVRTQASKWVHESTYASPKVGAGAHMVAHKVHIVATTIYSYCRSTNKGRNQAVMPLHQNVCWFILGDKGIIFDGVKVEPYVYDNEHVIWNSDVVKVPDDGTRQNCIAVPVTKTGWHYMKHEPRWNMWSQVVRSNSPDENWENWKSGKEDVRRFRPSEDPIMQNWHRVAPTA